MNIQSLSNQVGKRVAAVVNAAIASAPLAQRVATVSGCEGLLREFAELRQKLGAEPKGHAGGDTPAVRSRLEYLYLQEVEARRVKLRRTLEDDSIRLDQENKQELDAISLQIQGLEKACSVAEANLSNAEGKASDLQSRMDALSQELAHAREAASAEVEAAQTALRRVYEGDGGEEQESAAALALRRAQATRADAGVELELRIEGLAHRGEVLAGDVLAAQRKLHDLSQQLAAAKVTRYQVRIDMATRSLIEAMASGAAESQQLAHHLPSGVANAFMSISPRREKFHIYEERRFPAGVSLISGSTFVGLSDMVSALAAEPDLALLAGETYVEVTEPQD